jgi:hypothetical protein
MAGLSSEFSACEATVFARALVIKSTHTGSRLSTMFLSKMLRAALRSMGLPAARGEDCGCLNRSAVKSRRWMSRSQRRVWSRSVGPSVSTPRRRWVSWSSVAAHSVSTPRRRWVSWSVPSARRDGGGCLDPWSAWSATEVGVLVRDGGGCLGPRRRWVSWSVVRLVRDRGGCLGPLGPLGSRQRWVSWSGSGPCGEPTIARSSRRASHKPACEQVEVGVAGGER